MKFKLDSARNAYIRDYAYDLMKEYPKLKNYHINIVKGECKTNEIVGFAGGDFKYKEITYKTCTLEIEIKNAKELQQLAKDCNQRLILDFDSDIPIITIYDDYIE